MSSLVDTDFSARRRRRASMACLSCRKSRIRCRMDPGEITCSQCRQSETECTFDARDGRKNRANSKAVASELSKRIQQLEKLLRENGQGHAISSPPIDLGDHPHLQPMDTDSHSQHAPCFEEEPPSYTAASQQADAAPPNEVSVQSKAIVGKLAPRPVKFDMASGRVRFFGPTTNMHILSRSTSDQSKTAESFWPISMLVRGLSSETHDYLIDLFFDCHNSALHIVHKWAFFDDLKAGGTQFYSSFLHMTILAEGYRYADRLRMDIKKLTCPGPDSSVFHTKAKKMAELELLQPGGVPSIQAFFLLGDLEVGIGRDDSGWMFAGMAFRLLFDVGLHVDPCELRLTEREVQIRHMVLWACIMNDVYWALYLGRPTMLKASDIAPACLDKDFDRLIESQTRTYAYEKTIETKVYEALLQLMDLLEPLCETRDLSKNLKPSDAYLKIATLDRELNNWYADLPERLRWTSGNLARAPASFYLLHTQYHTALILLHRTFPNQTTSSQSSEPASSSAHFSTLSRSVCVSNAIQVADAMKQYRKRYPIRRIFVTGLQHVGTAATALMAEVSMLQSEQDNFERLRLLEHLGGLRDSMREMSEMYQPATMMSTVVGHFIRDSEQQPPEDITDPAKQPIDLTTDPRSGPGKVSATKPSTAVNTRANSLAPPGLGHKAQSSAGHESRGTITRVHDPGIKSSAFERNSGLPFLPSSWFEEMNWEEDTDFLNLMGLKDLQDASASGKGFMEGFSMQDDNLMYN